MTDLMKADAVAALRRASDWLDEAAGDDEDYRTAAILLALADAIERAEELAAWTDHDGTDYPDKWIIPAPRLP